MRKPIIGVITAVMAVLALAGTANAEGARVPEERVPVPEREAPDHVRVVARGDTLAGIAPELWREVCIDNGLADCNLIHPGQRINLRVLYDDEARLAARIKADQLDAWFQAVAPRPEPTPEAPAQSGRAPSPPAPAPAPSAPPPAPTGGTGVWDQLAQCESGGNWAINTGNGYYGGLQFSLSSWQAVGGTGYPHEHSRETQIAMGQRLQASQGWGAWPACSAQLGLR